MSQLLPDSCNSSSEPGTGIKQQADNTSMSSGMQAIQGDGNVQIQGNNILAIVIQHFDGIQRDEAEKISSFLQQVGLESLRPDYTQRQFGAYAKTWDSLNSLKEYGDDLWKEATINNLVKFAKQLSVTKKIVQKNAPYFLDSDYRQLLSVLQAFEEFHVGKKKLIDIRSKRDIKASGASQRTICYLIEANSHHMTTYENIVGSISISFRRKLST